MIDRFGPATGPLVVLLHGACANRHVWAPVVRALGDGVGIVAPDLPGHGARDDGPFSLAATVAIVDAERARAPTRRLVLAGDSLGGYLALAIAAASPFPPLAVVAGGCTYDLHGARAWAAYASDLPVRLAAAFAGERVLDGMAARGMSALFDTATASDVARGGVRLATRWASIRELSRLDLPALVAGIAAPVAFVNGRFDWPTRLGERRLLSVAQRARLVVAPACGHGVSVFAPATFAAVIRDELAASAATA